jgi:PAS domain-containing protein
MIDASSVTTFVNGRMAAFLGYRVDEMIGVPLYEFIHADARTELFGWNRDVDSVRTGRAFSRPRRPRPVRREGQRAKYDPHRQLTRTA